MHPLARQPWRPWFVAALAALALAGTAIVTIGGERSEIPDAVINGG